MLAQLGRYFILVFTRSLGIVSAILTLLLVLSTLGYNVIVSQGGLVALLFISIFLAGFQVYRHIAPERPRVQLDYTIAILICGTWQRGFPKDPVFHVPLELRNLGAQEVIIRTVGFIKLDIGKASQIFDTSSTDYFLEDSSKQRIRFPYRLPARELMQLTAKIKVSPKLLVADNERHMEEFARKLNGLENERFHIQLLFWFENLEGTSLSKKVDGQGSFATFKSEVINKWREAQQHKLINLAHGL